MTDVSPALSAAVQLAAMTAPIAVDPWSMQHDLMAASDQDLPNAPEINKGVLLYAALNLEECSEIMIGLVKALDRITGAGDIDGNLSRQLVTINEHLASAGAQMHAHSLAVRDELKAVSTPFRFDLTRPEVKEIADGSTDLMVTNSGFALSLGVNGGDCYLDVAGSNLSKKNPDTGKIDKTPDGKWIKGRDYREPDLIRTIYKD